MKKIIVLTFFITFILSILNIPTEVKAKGGAYYKSASSGRFTTKSSYYKSPSTTYRSYRR